MENVELMNSLNDESCRLNLRHIYIYIYKLLFRPSSHLGLLFILVFLDLSPSVLKLWGDKKRKKSA